MNPLKDHNYERAFKRIREFRALANRYDKRGFVYLGIVDTAGIKSWLRDPASHSRDMPKDPAEQGSPGGLCWCRRRADAAKAFLCGRFESVPRDAKTGSLRY